MKLKNHKKQLLLIIALCTLPFTSTSYAVSEKDEIEMLESLPPHLRPLFFYGEIGGGDLDPNYPEEYSLFDKDGGGMELILLPTELMDKETLQSYEDGAWEMMELTGGFPVMYTESYAIDGLGRSCATYDCAETMALAPYVSKETCQFINAREGITSISDDPPETNIDLDPFPTIRTTDPADRETFKTMLYQGVLTSTGGDISGKHTACVAYDEGGENIYIYYTVLHVR